MEGGMVEDESKPGGESERGWVGLGLLLVAVLGSLTGLEYAAFCKTRTAEE